MGSQEMLLMEDCSAAAEALSVGLGRSAVLCKDSSAAAQPQCCQSKSLAGCLGYSTAQVQAYCPGTPAQQQQSQATTHSSLSDTPGSATGSSCSVSLVGWPTMCSPTRKLLPVLDSSSTLLSGAHAAPAQTANTLTSGHPNASLWLCAGAMAAVASSMLAVMSQEAAAAAPDTAAPGGDTHCLTVQVEVS